jgi:hypothetical protein
VSIDIEIIPTVDAERSWGEVRKLIVDFSPADQKFAMSGLLLLDAQTRRPLADTEPVRRDNGYFFGSDVLNTLSMCFIDKDEADDDEAYIEEVAKRMPEIDRNNLLIKWKKIPYSILVSSGAGRSGAERRVIGCVTAGIAAAWKGYVAAPGQVLSIERGIYSPEEFAGAEVPTP